MNGREVFSLILILVQIAVLLYVIVRSVRLSSEKGVSPAALFFAFGLIGILVSDFYWVAYSYIRPDVRMPFAVNEVGEWAGFLLLASSLKAVFAGTDIKGTVDKLFLPGILTVLFTAASTAFWIAWSGEWMQDIVSGIVCGYFFYMVVRSLIITDALGKRGMIISAVLSYVLLGFQAMTFIVPEEYKIYPDTVCYVLMFGGIALLFGRLIYMWIKKYDEKKLLAVSYACVAWGVSCMYMSAEPMYFGAVVSVILSYLFIFYSLRRVINSQRSSGNNGVDLIQEPRKVVEQE